MLCDVRKRERLIQSGCFGSTESISFDYLAGLRIVSSDIETATGDPAWNQFNDSLKEVIQASHRLRNFRYAFFN